MRAPLARLLLLAALLLAGCAGAVEPAEFDRAAQAEIARQPDWYTNGEARAFLVRRNGQTRAVLWGTLHIGYDGDTMLPRALRQYFAEASDLTLELSPQAMAPALQRARNQAFLRYMQTPSPAALARLDPASRDALDASLPSGSTGRLSLMGLAAAVRAQAAAALPGNLPQVGFVDLNLMGFARNQHIPIHGLDPPSPQIVSLMFDPNGSEAASSVRQALRQRSGFKDFTAWIRRTYARGQVALTIAALNGWQADAENLAQAARLRETVVAARNRAWIPRLNAVFSKPGLHFVAFGAGHLVGEDGVPALLRREGWEVVPCVADACPG